MTLNNHIPFHIATCDVTMQHSQFLFHWGKQGIIGEVLKCGCQIIQCEVDICIFLESPLNVYSSHSYERLCTLCCLFITYRVLLCPFIFSIYELVDDQFPFRR